MLKYNKIVDLFQISMSSNHSNHRIHLLIEEPVLSNGEALP